MSFIKIFLTAFPVFLLIDAVWLGIISSDFYSKELGGLARREGPSLSPNWFPAFLSYALIVLGIAVFVIPRSESREQSLLFGFLFGIIAYGVYDLVNLATLEGWSLKMTIVDMLWGGMVCGIVSAITYYLNRM